LICDRRPISEQGRGINQDIREQIGGLARNPIHDPVLNFEMNN
jgi:hypothetical protein